MSISRRILVAVLGGLVPLIVALVAAASEVRSTIRHEVFAGLGRVADLEQAGITQALGTTNARLEPLVGPGSPLADALRSGEEDEAALSAALTLAVGSSPTILAVAVYRIDGSLIGDRSLDGFRSEPVSPAAIAAALQGATPGRAFLGPEGAARFQVLLPVMESGRAAAMLVVECSFAPILEVLSNESLLGRTTEAHLVQQTPSGGAEFISPLRFAEDAAFHKVIPREAVDTPAILALHTSDGVLDGLRDYRSVEVVAAFRAIPDTSWALVVKIDSDEAFARSSELASSLALTGAAVGLFLIIGLAVTARSVVQRLRHVTQLAEAISHGDLSRRIGRHSADEFGRLARAFDDMADTLQGDIERRQRVEAELQYRARHDDLTGLPGRVVAVETLTAALSDPTDALVGLLFCDLDSFKTINDELGHNAGDALLQQAARRLVAVARPNETVSRFGGDEFVVVCADLQRSTMIDEVAERVRAAMATPFSVAGRSAVVTVSIGSVVVPTGTAASAEVLLRDADAAMYRAKELGRNRHVPLDDETRLRASVGLSAVMALRQALAGDELTLHYQPIIDLHNGTVLGVESLLRRPDRSGRAIPGEPAALVALAESSGMAVQLDKWVFATACRQLVRWAEAGCESLCLSVNVSAASLADLSMVPFLVETASANGVSPQRLCLELTEVALRHDHVTAAEQLRRLRAAGFRIAIDDFGVGYSNLHRLRQLPVDVLKLDRGFLNRLDSDAAAREVCAAVVRLGVVLGLEVVAEGVEQVEQHQALVALGCHWAQGYLFAPALDPDTLLQFVRQRGEAAHAAPMAVGSVGLHG